MKERSKRTTRKFNFYLPIISELKIDTNLGRIKDKLNISKQQLAYYLRQLKKKGFVIQKGRGWYELSKKSKNPTKYGIFLDKDISRGHAYVWKINLKKDIEHWDKRIDILKKKNINYKLVGAKETTPRIKVLGRKVWLCNNHIRIFDKRNESYYGDTAKESRDTSLKELFLIVGALERKLGVLLKPLEFSYQKEHYALIKNDLAIDQNRKGIIWRIKDEDGEWLLIDDSLEQGGELETTGKKAFKTNIDLQKWWNDNKKHKFKVTSSFILNGFNSLTQATSENQQLLKGLPDNMELLAKQISSHLALIKEYRKENIAWRKNTEKKIRKELKNQEQTKLGGWF